MKSKIRKAVIPAAGLGTRMLPLTKSQPKEMLPLGSKPCIQHIVEELCGAGIEQILFVVGDNKQAIENHFDKNAQLSRLLQMSGQSEKMELLNYENYDTTFFYTRQAEPKGLGHAIGCARDFIGDEPFLVALGDAVITSKGRESFLSRMLSVYDDCDDSLIIGTRRVPYEQTSHYGIVEFDGKLDAKYSSPIKSLIEKPPIGQTESNMAISARYILPPSIFDAIDSTQPGKGGEVQLTDAIMQLIRSDTSGRLVSLKSNETRYDIGSMADYYKAFVDFALADERHGASIRAHVVKTLKL